ncbi:hypothetical protein R50073_26790 [Maricurvus nonylphenolicus]|uniref:hypothetical protein n=1 Tax=Maricurvus nonylphenolicus TaxID=1008307 RepID=UPI0036F20192
MSGFDPQDKSCQGFLKLFSVLSDSSFNGFVKRKTGFFLILALALVFVLAWGGHANVKKLIKSHKYITRFLCSKSIQYCMTYEKPGAGLGIYVTLRKHYRGLVLEVASLDIISAVHLKKISGISTSVNENIEFDVTELQLLEKGQVQRFEYRPAVYLPREYSRMTKGRETFISLFFCGGEIKPDRLYFVESDGEYFIVPDCLVSVGGLVK